MGTIADKLQKLLSTKEAIKQAIIQKGIQVADSDTFFSYASKIQQIETGGGTGGGSEDWEITDCSHLFRDAARLEQFDEIASHVKNPNTFYYMFAQNSSSAKKTEFDMSKFGNTSAVESCERMFNNCAYITKIINFNNFENCEKTNYMFYNCTNLAVLDLSNVDFSKVKNASNMFYACKKLQEINITFKAVEDISNIFYNCSSLTTINLKNVLGSGTVTNMSNAFARMNALTSILNIDLSAITSTTYLNFFGSYAVSNLKNITFKAGTTLGKTTQTSEIILNLTRATNFDADGYVNMLNTLEANVTGYTRTIKLYTNLYNSLTDEQKALATNKNYNLSYGTS